MKIKRKKSIDLHFEIGYHFIIHKRIFKLHAAKHRKSLVYDIIVVPKLCTTIDTQTVRLTEVQWWYKKA